MPEVADAIEGDKSVYEKMREERIQGNLERMQQLGIPDLSLEVKSTALSERPPRAKRPRERSPAAKMDASSPPGPRRRSSRIENLAPKSYIDVRPRRENVSLVDKELIQEGEMPEVYTEEHEKLLGTYEKEWILFVDGIENGKRIYDKILGKSCHQCRQKTLGYRTFCSNCKSVQGQLCGDCLFMRYGENVLEANQNPKWICPVCRGICNCSLCRIKKGWNPTGALYSKIRKLGYKSVAHYLIQTLRANSEAKDSQLEHSAKRSLPSTESSGISQVNAAGGSENLGSVSSNGMVQNVVELTAKTLIVDIKICSMDEPVGLEKLAFANGVQKLEDHCVPNGVQKLEDLCVPKTPSEGTSRKRRGKTKVKMASRSSARIKSNSSK